MRRTTIFSRFASTLLKPVSIALGCLLSYPTHATVITFDDLPANTIVTNQYAALGVTFSLIGSSQAGPLIPPQLAPSGQFITPSSDYITGAFDYDIQILFTPGADQASILVMDAEEPFEMLAYLGSTLVATGTKTSLGGGFGGPNYLDAITGVVFDRVVIDLTNDLGSGPGGPEAYDNLSFELVATPEPATFTLLAFGALGLMQFRRKRVAAWPFAASRFGKAKRVTEFVPTLENALS